MMPQSRPRRRVVRLSAHLTEGAAVPAMGGRLAAPRAPPLPQGEWREDLQKLGGAAGPNPSPYQQTLYHHPDLAAKWVPLARYVVQESTIATGFTRQRNLTLARTSWILKNDYAFHAYVNNGHGKGAEKGELSAADVAAVGVGSGAAHWASAPLDKAAVKAAEELQQEGCVSDATWAELLKGFGGEVKCCADLVASCGWYSFNSMMENTLGVQKAPPPAGGHHLLDFNQRAGRQCGPVDASAARPTAPRLHPVDDGKPSKPRNGSTLNVQKTFMNHPDLNRPFGQFAFHVVGKKSTISTRQREIAICRIGWLLNSKYEWNQHVWIAEDVAGFTSADFRAVEAGPASPYWPEHEQCIVAATDELRANAFITEPTWERLAMYYTLQQRMDIIAAVGQYTLVSFMLNSLGVQLEDWVTPYKGGPVGQPYQSAVGRFKYFDGKYH